nr:MAG TPA: Terminase large subunit [Caudoviricetes sp.]
MAVKIISTGITMVDDDADNSDVSYSLRDNLNNMNPIPDNNTSRKRYVPLVGNLFNKLNKLDSTKAVQSDTRCDATGNYVTVFYQMNTKNKSFLEMHYYLKARGIKNNKFHLLLYDRDLANVDPYDLNLPTYMKQKIFLECQRNFWYYVREVVRVQSQGGPYVMYKLDRGNLALNFCFTLNLNIYEEQPRQTGKTVGTNVWFSWVYNFGSRNANMIFLNKKHDDAKRNLNDLKNIIKALPSYLRFDQAFGIDGKKLKATNTVQYLQHKINFNKIEALPMARNRTSAISLLRGRTVTNCWIDESAFFQYLEESLQNGMPALTTAFRNCKQNGAPHGLCLTSTPGFLTTEEGQYMFDLKNKMTPFSELWYDFSLQKLTETLNANEKSIFVYIKTTYQQLGLSEDWLKERIKEQNQKWTDIRREYLLEWATSSENCPFTQDELKNVERFVRNPIKQVYISNFLFNIYSEISPKDKTLIGVDVAAGYSKDSSAISVTDSATTKLVADFNCNYINPVDLGNVIYTLVLNYLPNSLVTIERNGVGTGTLAQLMKSRIRNNLYYEIKERVIEERLGFGTKSNKRKQVTKVYGVDNSKEVRERLMDLLTDRVRDHYDKFVSPQLLEELKNLEIKKTGRIDHSANSHDDGIFSYLYSIYPLYYGKNVRENWHIDIPTLRTASDEAQEIFQDYTATESVAIVRDIENLDNDEMITEQLSKLDKTKLYNQFLAEQKAENDRAMAEILRTKIGREAYSRQFNMNPDQLDNMDQDGYDMLGVIDNFYNIDE